MIIAGAGRRSGEAVLQSVAPLRLARPSPVISPKLIQPCGLMNKEAPERVRVPPTFSVPASELLTNDHSARTDTLVYAVLNRRAAFPPQKGRFYEHGVRMLS